MLEYQFIDFTVDGGWSDWLIGNCSVSCVKERTRSCNNPEPSCGGKNCSGPAVETMKCNELPCEGLLYIVKPSKYALSSLDLKLHYFLILYVCKAPTSLIF